MIALRPFPFFPAPPPVARTIVLSHPAATIGAAHAARALARAGVLGGIWTSSDPPEGSFDPEMRATLGAERQRQRRASHLLDRTVSSRLRRQAVQGVYAYPHGAEATFRTAAELGMLRIYESRIAHGRIVRQLCTDEAEREPAWAPTLATLMPSPEEVDRIEAELALADLVVVPSTFVLRTLEKQGNLRATFALLPHGASLPGGVTAPRLPGPPRHRKLRALFAGPFTQARGLSQLFAAARQASSFLELTLLGYPAGDSCAVLDRELGAANWQPWRTTAQLRRELATHDVLLAPSLVDECDPVFLEAMAAGLPIVATPHTVAPDLIEHGREGFIVSIRSAEEIVARVEQLHRSRELLDFMSGNARERAHRCSWARYEDALGAGVAAALACL